jgi:hypothetical protein
MEKVFLISGENLPKGSAESKEYPRTPFVAGEAIIEKVLGSNRYLVSLADGTKLTAIGPVSINKGTKVQVSALSTGAFQKETAPNLTLSIKNGDRWSALIPLKLGNRTSEAKLELYVEREKAGFLPKKDAIVYLAFSVKTETYGQIQWVVYLKVNQVLIQVYAEKGGVGKKDISLMIKDFEGSLKKKGFSLLAPTVILKKPFKVPTGFQLNVRG